MASDFIMWGQDQSVWLMWLLMLLASFGCLLLLHLLFAELGLYIGIVLAVLGANIQVLKLVSFEPLFGQSVAMGTILFTMTYLSTDILCERYGKMAAFRGVMLGFVSFAVWTLWMNMTIAFPPYIAQDSGVFQGHDSIETIFSFLPQFFIASISAFLLSQVFDVFVFDLIKKMTRGKSLWLRNNVSTVMSALVDNTIFSILAWIVLSDSPLPWSDVILTYILGTFFLRVLVAILDTPFVYIGKWMPVIGGGGRKVGKVYSGSGIEDDDTGNNDTRTDLGI